jgi:hypothetical protein
MVASTFVSCASPLRTLMGYTTLFLGRFITR